MPRPDGKLVHAALRINGFLVMLNDDFPEMCGGKSMTPKSLGGTPVTIHLHVTDVDAAFQRALDAGATVVMPLEDQFWGDRYGVVADPFGHQWSLAETGARGQHRRDRGGDEQQRLAATQPSRPASIRCRSTASARRRRRRACRRPR